MTHTLSFGTDGIRGIATRDLPPDLIVKLGYTVGKVLMARGYTQFLIGKDTRASCYILESAFSAGVYASGMHVTLTGPIPTPAIAYLVKSLPKCVGVVISASHNPWQYNGFKFFDDNGYKFDVDTERVIIEQLNHLTSIDAVDVPVNAKRMEDARGRYIEHCKKSLRRDIDLSKLRICIDASNGAAWRTAPGVFQELGAITHCMGTAPNGQNINHECGATDPVKLTQMVLEHQADMGIALDGDADRVVVVTNSGRVLDGDDLLYILSQTLPEEGHKSRGICGTVQSNLGLERHCNQNNIGFKRVNVGDRNISEHLRQTGWALGGESSGHIILNEFTPSGDGIISALAICHHVLETQLTVDEIMTDFDRASEAATEVILDHRQDVCADSLREIADNWNQQLGHDSHRVIVRKSGTEPKIRINVQGPDLLELKKHCTSIAQEVQRVIPES